MWKRFLGQPFGQEGGESKNFPSGVSMNAFDVILYTFLFGLLRCLLSS
jgi:hypothetical protein